MIRELIIVGIGGAIGSIIRYSIKMLFIYFHIDSFLSTLTVNILGSFLIGIVISSVYDKPWNLFLIIGCLGGFTTFSSFSADTVSMFQNGELLKGLGYVSVSIIICLIMTYLGLMIGKKI